MYKIISTGSQGNAVLYTNVLVDIGVSYKAIEKYKYDISIVLLTHIHQDHFNIGTLERLQKERPTLRIGCGEWMYEYVKHLKNIDVYEIGKPYHYGYFNVSPVLAYHDVMNCGYRISINNNRIFHITDTSHLEGIEAKGYDLYAIEANYDEVLINEKIQEKRNNNEFAYQTGSINSHLSLQQCQDYFINNKKETSELIYLHQSKTNL
jgi:L-ascorbate metabolism protein UlaG (beta-lactamase superfamily)